MVAKAKYHYLVLPKEDISSLKKIKDEHIDLLKHMENVGISLSEKYADHHFLIGYHAQASMSRLHLHVISDDFDSHCLKTKKHWNSYTSEFFIPYSDVYKDVITNGQVTMKSEEECKRLLSLPLMCNKCNFIPANMPKLKEHFLTKHKIK